MSYKFKSLGYAEGFDMYEEDVHALPEPTAKEKLLIMLVVLTPLIIPVGGILVQSH